MEYTSIILTALTITTSILAIVTFINGRNKESRHEAGREATLRSELSYIKDVLIDVRREMKEINQLLANHSERLTTCEEKIKSAFSRIEHIEKRMDK